MIDYLDGNLSPEMVAELLLFLEQNPDLKEEAELLENTPIMNEQEIVFENKNILKKPVFSDEQLVAFMENDLSATEQKKIKKAIESDIELNRRLQLFMLTRLQPELNIVFRNKEALKRGARVVSMYYYFSAAAGIIILLLFYFFLNNKPATQVAEDNKNNTTIVPSESNKKPEEKIKSGPLPAPTVNTPLAEGKSIKKRRTKYKNIILRNEEKEKNTLADQHLQKKEISPVNDVKQEQILAQANTEELISDDYKITTIKADGNPNDEETESAIAPAKQNGLMSLASNSISKLTGNRLKVRTRNNEEGKVVGLDVKGNNIEFSKNYFASK